MGLSIYLSLKEESKYVDNTVRTAKPIYFRIGQTQRRKLEKLKMSRTDDLYIRPLEVGVGPRLLEYSFLALDKLFIE